jgi:chromate transport protein ChrA
MASWFRRDSLKASRLDLSLKGWAAAILISAGIAYWETQTVNLPRVVVAHLLFALSLFLQAQPVRIAVFSAAFALVVFIGSAQDYLNADLSHLSAVVDLLGFGATAWFAFAIFRGRGQA